jgi:release factor glutamine methyltransferase
MPQKAIFQELLLKIEGKLHILIDKSEENPHNTLCALWQTAAGNRVSAISSANYELPFLASIQHNLLDELIDNRLSGVPLAHITERQHFLGMDYILNKGHYIPRKDTELLAETTISLLSENYANKENVTVLDLCSGIGTVALAIANYCKNTKVYGSDIYQPAIVAAEINAKHFGLEEAVKFVKSDMFDQFELPDWKGNADVIVCAPPYISTSKVKQMPREISEHEPSEAFDAGPFGLSIFNQLIAKSPEYLRNNGYLIFECGAGQGEFLAKRLNSNDHYGEITEIRDERGDIRVLKAQKLN